MENFVHIFFSDVPLELTYKIKESFVTFQPKDKSLSKKVYENYLETIGFPLDFYINNRIEFFVKVYEISQH